MPRSRTKCYNLYMFLYSHKRLSWWWWCVCHPSFLTIRSASNNCEVSCGIFATIAHFSAPICRKPLIILKATTSLPHLIKTAWEIYFEWKVLPPFLNICLSRDFNKWPHMEQNEWIYTVKYDYIHVYVIVHLKSLKRQIFRNGGSNILGVYQNKSDFFHVCEQVLLFYYFGSVTTHGHIASKRKRHAAFTSHPHTPGNREYSTARPARHIA